MTTAYKRRHHGRFRLFVAFAQQYRGYHRIPAGYPVPQADALNMKVVRKGSTSVYLAAGYYKATLDATTKAGEVEEKVGEVFTGLTHAF